MATIASLIPLVSMHVRNCPDPTIEDAFLRIAREFCKETRWLRETLVRSIVADQAFYDFTADMSQCEVIGVNAIQVSDQDPLTPAAFEETSGVDGTRTGVQADSWAFTPPARIWLLRDIPDDDLTDGLAIRAILQPTSDATELPDELLRHNDRALADGVIAWLCSMTKAGWGDPSMVSLFGPSYENAKARAQLDSDNQFKPFNIRTTAYR